MRALWFVEDCVKSSDNHLARGAYSRGAKFQNGCLAFWQCHRRSNECGNIEISIPKSTEDSKKYGVTLFKRGTWSFCWSNYAKHVKFKCSNKMLGKKCRYFTIESKQANKHRDLQNLLKLLSCWQLAWTTRLTNSYKKFSGHATDVSLAKFCMEMFDGCKWIRQHYFNFSFGKVAQFLVR